jgi:hypothetical protein
VSCDAVALSKTRLHLSWMIPKRMRVATRSLDFLRALHALLNSLVTSWPVLRGAMRCWSLHKPHSLRSLKCYSCLLPTFQKERFSDHVRLLLANCCWLGLCSTGLSSAGQRGHIPGLRSLAMYEPVQICTICRMLAHPGRVARRR